jgi:hypothetical protein
MIAIGAAIGIGIIVLDQILKAAPLNSACRAGRRHRYLSAARDQGAEFIGACSTTS